MFHPDLLHILRTSSRYSTPIEQSTPPANADRLAWHACAVREIVLSDHAVERYQERVKPALDLQAAREDLTRMLRIATVQKETPSWGQGESHGQPVDAWAIISEGVCAPLARRHDGSGYFAITVLTHRGISDESRARRNVAKAAQRRRRARHRMKWVERNQEKAHRRQAA